MLCCYQFTTFDTMPTEDSFSGLTSCATMTSLPVPVSVHLSSPKSAVGDWTMRSRVSRALSFDEELSPSPCCGVLDRPSLTPRRRCPRLQPPQPPPAVFHDFSHVEQSSSHFATQSRIICRSIQEDEDRADLIGDMSMKHVLPLEPNSQHADLKTCLLYTSDAADE